MLAYDSSTPLTDLPEGIVQIGQVLPVVFGWATIHQLGLMYRLRPHEVREVLLRDRVPVWFGRFDWLVLQLEFQAAYEAWRGLPFRGQTDLVDSSLRAQRKRLGGNEPEPFPEAVRVDVGFDSDRGSRLSQNLARRLENTRITEVLS
ncbi:hypothetical protein Sinac_7640 (plasmid) [Singulisphaera acidiphila DSM 18658]|uniref:Uncharacterized protein n=1 Tax=Singulisphaera acidiphila (strain ATCC BAA-1392 / DSM 18658 / VKM B-2454 / MOB10) TaxID=886293 RepID=L0DRP7_SINAD|nr:hypothetical protein Sinac_7640 [Singulisphaera acidiphila DSM 18658]